MSISWWRGRRVLRVAVPVLLAGTVAGSGAVAGLAAPGGLTVPVASAAAGCVRVTGLEPPGSGGGGDGLGGVAVLSGCDAWAVGSSLAAGGVNRTLAEHYDGSSWTVVPSPSPGADGENAVLSGVAAVAPNDVWAVGLAAGQALVEHWDGGQWQAVQSLASPVPGSSSRLQAVTVISAADIWTVGRASGFSSGQTLIEHWDGIRWSVVPSPSPGSSGNRLRGVTALTTQNVWAVGSTASGGLSQTLIERWNGNAWIQIPSPSPNDGSELAGITATSDRDIWAVGDQVAGTTNQTLAEHFDGNAWTVVPSPDPNPGASNLLSAVGASASTSVWMVGAAAGQAVAINCC